jgi:hypothetical protein
VALSLTAIAFGAVVVTCAALFSIGAPDERAKRMAVAAPAPAAETSQATPVPSIAAGGGTTLRSVSVEFPTSGRAFPGGAEADVINNNCLACHSAGMVLTQPTLSRAAWQGVVEKMRETYKAPIAATDTPAIVHYLAEITSKN